MTEYGNNGLNNSNATNGYPVNNGMNYNYGASYQQTATPQGQSPYQHTDVPKQIPDRTQGAMSSTAQNTAQNAPHSVPQNAGQNPAQNQAVRKAPQKTPKKDSMGRKIGRTAVIAAVFGLTAGLMFQGVNLGVDKLRSFASKSNSEEVASNSNSSVKSQQVVNSSGTTTLSYDVANIVETAQPSIVSITTTSTESIQYFFQSYERPVSGAGSGIIIGQDDDKLYIATNYHVVSGAEEINVGFNDGEMVNATVKGTDENADIAVVEVLKSEMKDSTKESISVAQVGNSDELQVGEPAIAIGNALGYGQSVTVGYISALNRPIEDSEGTFIQTDAAINPGNSGGALINSQGQVIGINSVKYVDSTVEGMGFSIPINSAMSIINDIIAGTQKGNAYLGIKGAAIGEEYSKIYGFPKGIYIQEVTMDSPAEDAGLHKGDIIVEFDGQEVYTVEELQQLLKKYDAGDEVKLVVYRADTMGDYDKTEVEVTLKTGN
ncbi:MAG: trypsin-like peptidase domain-containing protein [Eubacterium sp.]|nr:trypsin-like peptidase domain-containing protein [Eubacterium sp.]